MSTPLVIGIAGGSGSGKTTIVDRLLQCAFGSQIALLCQDAYYLNADKMPEEIRQNQNWDHPDSLDNHLFLQHIDDLLGGKEVHQPIYDFATHSRTEQTVAISPRPILLLEGILLLAIPEIRARIHLGVFVDTPPDLRFVRRLIRDINERGRTIESVSNQYQKTVRPMHEQFVQPSQAFAHIIIPWVSHNKPAVETLVARIAAVLN